MRESSIHGYDAELCHGHGRVAALQLHPNALALKVPHQRPRRPDLHTANISGAQSLSSVSSAGSPTTCLTREFGFARQLKWLKVGREDNGHLRLSLL